MYFFFEELLNSLYSFNIFYGSSINFLNIYIFFFFSPQYILVCALSLKMEIKLDAGGRVCKINFENYFLAIVLFNFTFIKKMV